jgi:hypothetical protein
MFDLTNIQSAPRSGFMWRNARLANTTKNGKVDLGANGIMAEITNLNDEGSKLTLAGTWTYGTVRRAGIVAHGTTVTTSAGVGEQVLAADKGLRSVNGAGTDTLPLIKLLGVNNSVEIGDRGGGRQVNIGNQYLYWSERADPAAPGADEALLYLRDNGAGKSQLVIRFSTGDVVIATQP